MKDLLLTEISAQQCQRCLRMLPLNWFGRLYVALQVCVISLVASLGEESPLHALVTKGGLIGYWCALLLAAVAFVGVLDVVVNDLMPKRFRLCFFKRHRHFVLMGIGIGSLSFAGIIAMEVGWNVLHASLALPVLGATVLAVMDVFERGSQS